MNATQQQNIQLAFFGWWMKQLDQLFAYFTSICAGEWCWFFAPQIQKKENLWFFSEKKSMIIAVILSNPVSHAANGDLNLYFPQLSLMGTMVIRAICHNKLTNKATFLRSINGKKKKKWTKHILLWNNQTEDKITTFKCIILQNSSIPNNS